MLFLLVRRLKNLFIFAVSISIFPSFALEGGQPVNAADYKGLVMLSYSTDRTYGYRSIPDNCTGIVLQPRRVLTTSQCLTVVDFGFGIIPLPEIGYLPAKEIHVHPVETGVLTGTDTLAPVIKSSQLPNVGVTNYATHPRDINTIYSTATNSFELIVLYLDADIGIEPAVLYNGSNMFIDFSVTALGWEKKERTVNAEIVNEYVLAKLDFDLVQSSIDSDSNCREDNIPFAAYLFCGGSQNGLNFLTEQDIGAPAYRLINGRRTVLGLLQYDSNGGIGYGTNIYRYEMYARISAMVDFIKHHAPDTQFESGALTELMPASQLLLLQE